MLILTIRTDKPEAEIGLYDNHKRLAYHTWMAHRELAETLHSQLEELLKGHTLTIHNLQAIIAYQGPGSFTGLRIGLSVANALAYSNDIPIVGCGEDSWISDGIKRLENGDNDRQALPEYGALPNITQQRK